MGIEPSSFCASPAEALARAQELQGLFPGQSVLVEKYLPGREFNVSLLAAGNSVEALAVAEIQYVDFPQGMPRLLSYDAKWRPDTFAYTNTVRNFPSETALLASLRELAVSAWHASSVSGYARVDLRLDSDGAPKILDINANPCLAANGGFIAAANHMGLPAGRIVERILDAAMAHRP